MLGLLCGEDVYVVVGCFVYYFDVVGVCYWFVYLYCFGCVGMGWFVIVVVGVWFMFLGDVDWYVVGVIVGDYVELFFGGCFEVV